MTPAKACTVCGEDKPLTDYSPHRDGRQSACRACHNTKLREARAQEGGYDKAQRLAYNRALGALRDLHRAEFQRLYGQALRAEKSQA